MEKSTLSNGTSIKASFTFRRQSKIVVLPSSQILAFCKFLYNRPFAGSSHMARKKLHWDANDAVGFPKQRNSYQFSPTFLCFESPTAWPLASSTLHDRSSTKHKLVISTICLSHIFSPFWSPIFVVCSSLM